MTDGTEIDIREKLLSLLDGNLALCSRIEINPLALQMVTYTHIGFDGSFPCVWTSEGYTYGFYELPNDEIERLYERAKEAIGNKNN